MKHWVFDLDGTLVDSFKHYFEAVDTLFTARGVLFGDDLRHEALTRPLQEFFVDHLGSAHAGPALDELQLQSNKDAARIRPFDGIMELLASLSSRGKRLAVWTNRDRESAGLILEAAGLMPLLDTWVSGTCVQSRKPHPEGLLRIAADLGCAPEELTVVGDHDMDMIGAKAAGARAVRAFWHSYWPAEFCGHSDHQFDQVSRLHEWLRADR